MALISLREGVRNDQVDVYGRIKGLNGKTLHETLEDLASVEPIEVEELTVTENGTYTADDGKAYSPVVVNVSGSVIENQPIKDVNFFDYDGTCVYSYTFAEWASVTELPSQPLHEGLIADGWALFDNVDAVNTRITNVPNQSIYVFPYYKTDDGKTRLYLNIVSSYAIYFGFGVNGTIRIDWGDGSPTYDLTGTSLTTKVGRAHTYQRGCYVMSIEVISGSFRIGGTNGSPWLMLIDGNTASASVSAKCQGPGSALEKIEVGSNISFSDSGFYNFKQLKAITLSKGQAMNAARLFYNCMSLKCHPQGDYGTDCLCGTAIAYSTTSSSMTASKYASSNVRDVCLSPSITAIPSNCFYGCHSLTRIFIPSLVTSINANAFQNCEGLKEIHLYPTTPPSLNATSVFNIIPSNAVMYVPYSEDHSVLDAYQTATNWSSFASLMVEEPQ